MPVRLCNTANPNLLKFIFFTASDKTVRIWDAYTGEYLFSLVGHSLGISDVAWSPDSSMLATASDDMTSCLWMSDTGRRIKTFKGHTNYVMCVNFNPKGTNWNVDDRHSLERP